MIGEKTGIHKSFTINSSHAGLLLHTVGFGQELGHDFSMSQKSNSMLEFQDHICWVITVDYKVRLGQVKSEFN